MRSRGSEYKRWLDGGAVNDAHDEIIPGGTQISAEVRMSPHGACTTFVGIYLQNGLAVFEEIYATLHSSAELGLGWATDRAFAEHSANYSQVSALPVRPPRMV